MNASARHSLCAVNPGSLMLVVYPDGTGTQATVAFDGRRLLTKEPASM
jgi:hypothetical protein